MSRVITYNFGENFINNLAEFIYNDFFKRGDDLSRLACIFGGKRAALFLKAALARKIGSAYIPPRMFSMDEYVQYIVAGDQPVTMITALEASYIVYQLSRNIAPSIFCGRDTFIEFLPWAREIVSFIEQLDVEDIDSAALLHIEQSATIGYEVPKNINVLLQHISLIREEYQKYVIAQGKYSRGLLYRLAAKKIAQHNFGEFDAMLFCNFYFLYPTEETVVKHVYDSGKAICIFQGDEDEWPALKKNAQLLKVSLKPPVKQENPYSLQMYRGFDMHSQVCVAREIIKNIDNKKDTVIVLPLPEALIPLLSEITPYVDEFNVSMGYPLRRSLLYSLFAALFKVQESKKEDTYYTRDYLTLLQHPLIKNLTLGSDLAVTRVLVHKIEELVQGSEESTIGGCLFVSLQAIEEEEKLYRRAQETLKAMGIDSSIEECRTVTQQLHKLLLSNWEGIESFRKFSSVLSDFLDTITQKSRVDRFPFNTKIMEQLYSIQEELANIAFCDDQFEPYEIWKIFFCRIEEEKVSFIGSPLRGTQILGMLETRALTFENVIFVDMNEGVIPYLRVYEPLIPREVMLSLGVNRLEREEEIQRYQFMRLISSAKNVHLIYKEDEVIEKSRFIEALLWMHQKQKQKFDVFPVWRANFSATMTQKEIIIQKTPEIIDFLKRAVYSASRIDVYLKCPLQFYYRYVLGVTEQEDNLEGPEAREIGTFIHELLETMFRRFLGQKPVIDASFEKIFFEVMESKFDKELMPRMRSDAFLLKGIIRARLEKFLEVERKRSVAKVLGIEERSSGGMVLSGEEVKFTYTIDRIDEFEDQRVIIIDYKTGGTDVAPRGYKALAAMTFDRAAIRDTIKSFQLPLYYYFLRKRLPQTHINAELYNLRTLDRKLFIAEDDILYADQVLTICMNALAYIISELFDSTIPFMADKQGQHCQHCQFKGSAFHCEFR